MKRFWLIPALTVLAILLTGCMVAATGDDLLGEDPEPIMVDVMLQETEGMTITGQNPVLVEAGSDVSFTVEVQDGYKIESVGQGAVYEDGTVTVKNVRFPTTVEVQTRMLYDYTFTLNNNAWQGEVTTNVSADTVKEDFEVTLHATPKEGLIFLGYTRDHYITQGGVVVCTTTDYTFSMTEDVTLYTNYYKVGNGRLLIYDSNGGNESLQYAIFSNSSPYICPNAMALKGQITRDGYVLYGYNTKADGSGAYYGPGWSVIMPEDHGVPLTLYAQWLPETEKEAFTYQIVDGKTVTITGYEGDHETVVIPETIDGLPVTEIAMRTFINEKFKTVYISRNVMTVQNGAFVNCAFETMYFCDQVKTISDNSFGNCKNFQNLYLLAVMDPRYSTSNNGTYKMKYQRLITAEGKKAIFHAGSNVSYGIDTVVMEKALGGQYSPVNFGCNYATPAVFFMAVAAAHMNEGDLIVLCPEIKDYQFGRNDINTTTWQIFEGAYNAFADVDIRRFTSVFASFSAFNTNRYSSGTKTYEQYHKSVNSYGDYILYHEKPVASLKESIAKWNSGQSLTNMDAGLLSKSYNDNMNDAIDLVNAKGGKVYISFASTLELGLNAKSRTVATQTAYKNAIAKAFPKAAVISEPGTYVMEEKWFYNSIYHLTTEGAAHRSKLLAKDILAQLAKEK